jgi:hypothetical protein
MTDQATVTIAQTWQEVNLESVCERAQVIAFDLDTTLARSKMRMTEEMGRRLATLTQLSRVAIVSGGRFEQFRAQVLDVLDGLDIPTDRTQLHLMPTSGTVISVGTVRIGYVCTLMISAIKTALLP